MAALTREDILAAIAARKAAVEELEVPDWGGTVYLRRLSVEALRATGFLDGTGDPSEVPLRVLAASVTDEHGSPLFSMDDVKALAEAEFQTVIRVFTEAARINGLSSAELEEAVAAFNGAQGDDNSSD